MLHTAETADTDLRRARVRALAWLLVVVVVVGAVAGLAAAVSSRAGLLGEPSDTGGYGVGDAAPAPFGTLQVTDVGTVDGVTHRALAGATHGVKSYVDGAHATVQTTLRVTNTTVHSYTWHVDQFRLRVTRNGRSTFHKPDGGNLPDTLLSGNSELAGHLDFTIPRKGARLALVLTPAHRSGPIVIDLGRATFDARAPGGHQH
jgi:hypothetical protein